MADTNTTVWVSIISATSAIVAVVITQIITAVNSRKSDERKDRAENRRSKINKKIEIGENFYHIFRESLINIHRQKNLFQKEIDIKSEESIKYFNELLLQIKASNEKLVMDNSKYNITEIYFPIESSSTVSATSASLLTNIIAKRIDLISKYPTATEEERYKIGSELLKVQSEMLTTFTTVAERIERDLEIVKKELLELMK